MGAIKGGTMKTTEPLSRRIAGTVTRIHVLEDNAGGLYLHLIGPDFIVAGMEQSEDAMTDCRLLRDWIDHVADSNLYDAKTYVGYDDLRTVAVYYADMDKLVAGRDDPGTAAVRYCKLWED